MPTDKTETQNQNHSQNPISDSQSSIVGGESQIGGKENIRVHQSGEHEKHRNKPRAVSITKIPKLDVIEGIEANRIAKRANSISFWSALASGFLFIVTLLVFNESRKQTQASIISAQAAKQSADLQKQALD